MELLIPEGAEILAAYDHYNWSGYAAVTRNQYGSGSAFYLGCMTGNRLLKKILREALKSAAVEIPEESFPVILRKGTNDLGNTVRFYLNYSPQDQEILYRFREGTDLLEHHAVKHHEKFKLSPWGVRIIEEN